MQILQPLPNTETIISLFLLALIPVPPQKNINLLWRISLHPATQHQLTSTNFKAKMFSKFSIHRRKQRCLRRAAHPADKDKKYLHCQQWKIYQTCFHVVTLTLLKVILSLAENNESLFFSFSESSPSPLRSGLEPPSCSSLVSFEKPLK